MIDNPQTPSVNIEQYHREWLNPLGNILYYQFVLSIYSSRIDYAAQYMCQRPLKCSYGPTWCFRINWMDLKRLSLRNDSLPSRYQGSKSLVRII